MQSTHNDATEKEKKIHANYSATWLHAGRPNPGNLNRLPFSPLSSRRQCSRKATGNKDQNLLPNLTEFFAVMVSVTEERKILY